MILGHLIAHAASRTKAGQLFNALMLLLFVLALPVGSVIGFSAFAWREVARERSYSRRFSDGWQMQYKLEQGSLSAARARAAVAVFGAVTNACLGVWLYRKLLTALFGVPAPKTHRRRRRSSA